jgi:hypothetical protein
MADADRKRELIAQIDRARSRAAANKAELEQDLRISDRVDEVSDKLKHGLKENVDHNRGIWLGGAALFGLLISKIPPRTKVLIKDPRGPKMEKAAKEAKQAGKAGLLMAALTWAFGLVRPMLISWATRQAQQYLAGGRGAPRGGGGYRPY